MEAAIIIIMTAEEQDVSRGDRERWYLGSQAGRGCG